MGGAGKSLDARQLKKKDNSPAYACFKTVSVFITTTIIINLSTFGSRKLQAGVSFLKYHHNPALAFSIMAYPQLFQIDLKLKY